MGNPSLSAPAPAYRALVFFWAFVLGALFFGAFILEMLGPPPHAAAPLPAAPESASAGAVASSAVAPVPSASASKPSIPPPDPALLEPAPEFPGRSLPQIGANNRTPMLAYAAAFDAGDKHPRVALVVSGAGLDQDQTLHLLTDLPAAVDVAFSAYMPENLEEQFAARARATGHECLQSVPMEPTGYPLSEEGARSLLTGADSEQNRQNLEWALTRMPGCVGATGASDGMLGERFAQAGQGFGDVLNEMAKRGLLYLDTRTGAPALPTNGGPNVRIMDMVVDQSPNGDVPVTAEVIDQRLATLEHLALVRGNAIGLAGPPKPVMLERIAVWARGLAARGVTLAPVSAMPGLPAPPPSVDATPPDSAN